MADEVRHVVHVRGTLPAWGLQDSATSSTSRLFPSEELALSTARRELATLGGGRIYLHDANGLVRQTEAVDGMTLEPHNGPPAESRPSVDDAVDAISAAQARIAQEDPGDDGDAALHRIVTSIGPDSASKQALNIGRVWIDVVVFLLLLFGAVFGVRLINPSIGGGVVGVFFSRG
jgi:hypothetical protein